MYSHQEAFSAVCPCATLIPAIRSLNDLLTLYAGSGSWRLIAPAAAVSVFQFLRRILRRLECLQLRHCGGQTVPA